MDDQIKTPVFCCRCDGQLADEDRRHGACSDCIRLLLRQAARFEARKGGGSPNVTRPPRIKHRLATTTG